MNFLDMFFTGLVVNVNDPLKVGRVKVRVYSSHDGIKEDALPWAIVGQPTTSSAVGGQGSSPTNLRKGSQVYGIYLDSPHNQQLLVMGVVGAVTDIHPKAIDGRHTKQTLLPGEPNIVHNTVYPENKVYATQSGHVIEVDDSPSNERITVKHKSGSYLEIDKNGSIIIKGKNNYILAEEDTTLYVGKDAKLQVDGNAHVSIKGDLAAWVHGSTSVSTSNQLHLSSPSVTITEVSTSFENTLARENVIMNKEGVIAAFDDEVLNGGSLDLLETNQLPLFKQPLSLTALEKFVPDLRDLVMEEIATLEKKVTDQIGVVEKSATKIYDKSSNDDYLKKIKDVKSKTDKMLSKIKTVKAEFNKYKSQVESAVTAAKNFKNDIKNLKNDVINQLLGFKNQIIQDIKDKVYDKFHINEIIEIEKQIEEVKQIVQSYNVDGIFNQSKTKIQSIATIQPPLLSNDESTYENLSDPVYEHLISKYFKLSDLTTNTLYSKNPLTPNNNLSVNDIFKNLCNLANTLDILHERYPGMVIRSAFRVGDGESDHYKGLAADIYWPQLSKYDHYNIIKWISESLYFQKVVYEQGTEAWIHLAVADLDQTPSFETYTMTNGQFSTGLNYHYADTNVTTDTNIL